MAALNAEEAFSRIKKLITHWKVVHQRSLLSPIPLPQFMRRIAFSAAFQTLSAAWDESVSVTQPQTFFPPALFSVL